jgi:hypothetical protein
VLAELVSQPGADAMQSRSRGRDAQPELIGGGGDRIALQGDENEQVLAADVIGHAVQDPRRGRRLAWRLAGAHPERETTPSLNQMIF